MTKLRLYDYIKKLLEDYPALRDSDKKLIWNVWGSLGYLTGRVIIREDFMKAPSHETIRRTRQKIQELNPHLRSSQTVMEAKIDIAAQRGTHIFREPIQLGI